MFESEGRDLVQLDSVVLDGSRSSDLSAPQLVVPPAVREVHAPAARSVLQHRSDEQLVSDEELRVASQRLLVGRVEPPDGLHDRDSCARLRRCMHGEH